MISLEQFPHLEYSSNTRTIGVSFAELADHFSDCEILHQPKQLYRNFSWYAQTTSSSEPLMTFLPNHVYLINFGNLGDQPQIHSDALFIILVEDGEDAAFERWLNIERRALHTLAIRKRNPMRYYAQRLEKLFVANLLWENELDYIVFRKERVDRLITLSDNVLGGFLCVTDTGFNLIAASQKIDPPNDVYRTLVTRGCYDTHEIAHLENDVLSRHASMGNTIECPPSDHNDCTTLHFPIYIDGAYVFHITLAVPAGADIEATKYRFIKFCRRARNLFVDFWSENIEIESPSHKVLIGLIDGSAMDPERIAIQISRTGIPEAAWFRLLMVKFSPFEIQSVKNAVIAAVAKLNDGRCHTFGYRGNVLILEYSDAPLESSLSLHKAINDYIDHVFSRFGIQCAISQLFNDIGDIRFAYQQDELCFEHAGTFLNMYPEGPAERNNLDAPTLPFDYILETMAFEQGLDQKLLDFTFSHSMVERLYAEDAENGTDLARLLWVYLRNERNASKTAEELCMHRNTVMYHIKKIEDRFEISLDSPQIRDFLHLEFVHHFRQ